MSIVDNLTVIQSLLDTTNIEVNNLQNKQIKTSAARARANLLSIKKLCDMIRKDILTEVKAIPTKTRTKTPESVEGKEDETHKPKPKPKAKGKAKK